jgi:putative transposase
VRAKSKKPVWKEWRVPELRSICLQANVNVVEAIDDKAVKDKVLKLEKAHHGMFDLWLKVATLNEWYPIHLPIKLASYHREALEGKRINSSVTLHRRGKNWWLTLCFDEILPEIKPDEARPKVAPDIGLASYLTTGDGKHYGTFHGKLAERHAAERTKRQRKAKLRACLEKKGVTKLPSTSSASSQRLYRHVKQEINQAVKQFMNDHPDHEIVLEKMSISSLHFKSRGMNAMLAASQLGHVHEQIKWLAMQRGQPITYVNPAYSSQECSRCHHTERMNRPNQQTFCCRVCGFRANADENAARNLERRAGDGQLATCGSLGAVKKLLDRRHETWRQENGWP